MYIWETNVIFILCLAFVASLIFDNQRCSAPSPCTCLNEFVECSGRHLTHLPTFTADSRPSATTHTLYVNLFSNNISVIPDNGFRALGLTGATAINIYLFNNQIISINNGAFAGVETLVHELDLENNRLTTLPVALGKLTRLQILYIHGNHLRILDAGVLHNIGSSLTEVRFSADYFPRWPSSLHLLNHLKSLQVDHIPFRTLANNSFTGLENTLLTLVISRSNLESFPDAICSLQALQTLTLSWNIDLKSTHFCARPMLNIKTVRLTNNNLTNFPDVFNTFPDANAITVSGNSGLFYIPASMLTNSSHVNLTSLNLDKNHFSTIPRVVGKLQSLKILSFKNNFIRVIDGDVFDNLRQLRTLQLNANPIMYIERTSFSGLTSLTTLDLTATSLSTIPEAVMTIASLTSLKLDNLALNCTCELTHHMTWLHVTRVAISGKCISGSMSLQNYVRHYLPLCK